MRGVRGIPDAGYAIMQTYEVSDEALVYWKSQGAPVIEENGELCLSKDYIYDVINDKQSHRIILTWELKGI